MTLGHNSMDGQMLLSYIERLEKLQAEKNAIAQDMKEVFIESKGNGYDNKIIKQIIKLRAMDEADRQEQEALLDLYKHATGMVSDNQEDDSDI